MTSLEPGGGKINDTCVFPGTGLILMALDSRLIPAYFIPDLGPAPKWSPRLQNWVCFQVFIFMILVMPFVLYLFDFKICC